MALAIRIQAEWIGIALESLDFTSLATMAGHLVATTQQEYWKPVNALAAQLKEAAEGVEGGELEGKLLPAAIEAVKAKATLGEMMDIFKETFGWVMY